MKRTEKVCFASIKAAERLPQQGEGYSGKLPLVTDGTENNHVAM
jgi:hypothetical protein